MANKYKLILTGAFRKDLKLIQKQLKDINLLRTIINELLTGNVLAPKYRDHALTGKWSGFRECHIMSDWLLIYLKDDKNLIITAVRSGSHARLLKK